MRKNTYYITLFFIALACLSCKKKDEETNDSTVSTQAVVENYSTIVHATYTDARDAAVTLKEKATTFVNNPSQENLSEVQNAYLNSRKPYEHSEAFRFYGGPIDNDTDGPEGMMNAWPMDEAYLDYVDGNSTSGIINDPINYPTINKESIQDWNEAGGETNIATGYHTIEFLLWGQDLSASGPGARPYTDYLTTGGTAANQARRGQYLLAAIDLLVDNLNFLVDAWEPNNSSNYRASFVADPNQSVKLLLTGLGNYAKGELAGERMTVAYNTQDQEDEHSCFSDDTHHDIVYGHESIVNVYTGRYTKLNGEVISGSSISDLVAEANATLNNEMLDLLNDAKNKTLLIQAPFDQEIINPDGRTRVLNAINAIKAEADKLVEAAAAIGIVLVIS